jgi:hypothetical protein
MKRSDALPGAKSKEIRMDGIDRRARNTFAYGSYEAVSEIKTIKRYIETMSLKARDARQPD